MSRLGELIRTLCPDGVEYKKINEISMPLSGMSAVSKKWEETGNCQFIDYMNVYKHIRVDVNDLPYATVQNISKQTVLKKGDVLFTSASETPDECALSAVIEDDIKDGIFIDDHLFGIRILDEYKETIFVGYLKYLFRSPCFRTQVTKTVRGVTRHYIAKPVFMTIEIPIPPIAVQKEIARILDKFTALEAELEAELEARKKQYEHYRDTLLSFTPPRR